MKTLKLFCIALLCLVGFSANEAFAKPAALLSQLATDDDSDVAEDVLNKNLIISTESYRKLLTEQKRNKVEFYYAGKPLYSDTDGHLRVAKSANEMNESSIFTLIPTAMNTYRITGRLYNNRGLKLIARNNEFVFVEDESEGDDSFSLYIYNDGYVEVFNSNGLYNKNGQIVPGGLDENGFKIYSRFNIYYSIPVEEITLSKTEACLATGSNLELTATIAPSKVTHTNLAWSSSNPSAATVSKNGIVTAVSPGIAVITAKAMDASGKTATCEVSVADVVYSYRTNEKRATVVSLNAKNIKDFSLPQTISNNGVEYVVDSIAPSSFSGSLTTLELPASIQHYGKDAFKNARISNISYNGTMAEWCACRFANESANPMSKTGKLVLNNVEVKNAEIPASIQTLNPYAFYGCTNIESVEIKATTLNSIGNSCFAGCKIKQLTVESSKVPTLGTNALSGAEKVAVPVDYYDEYYQSNGWKSVSNITSSIDNGTYAYFVSDHTLYHLNQKTGEAGISNPTDASSTTAAYAGTYTVPSTVDYNHQTYPVTTIESKCFENNTNLSAIKIPTSIKTIGESAFSGLRTLDANYLGTVTQWCEIDFADGDSNPMSISGDLKVGGVTYSGLSITSGSVNDYAFYGCRSLKLVTIGENVESIGGTAFAGCTGLETLKVNALCDVNASSFLNSPLTTIESGNEHFWISVADYFAKTLETAVIHDEYTGNSPSFANCIKLKNVTLSDKTTSITSFEGCTSLTEIVIPESVNAIVGKAFKNCRQLKTLTINSKNSITVGENAFVNCSALQTVNYAGTAADWCGIEFDNKYANPMYYAQKVLFQGKQLETLDVTGTSAKFQNHGFVNLKSLKKVVFSSITGGLGTFEGCSNLQEISLTAKQASGALVPGLSGEFDGVNKSTCVVYVPDLLVSEYKKAEVWREFSNIRSFNVKPVVSISIPQSITLQKYEQFTFSPTIDPSDVSLSAFKWTSSDESVAIVDANGVLSTYSDGIATITITSISTPSVSASCVVSVGNVSGIENATVDDGSEATYYSVQGLKLSDKPRQAGVYIMVKNGKSQKVVIRQK